MRLFIAIFLIFSFTASVAQPPKPTYQELYRPVYHFSPAINWTNDPNGLLYFDGEYHIFYQYNPFGNKWGHMSWGHAISKDLIHWQHLPLAIPEADKVMIFSGSCVADIENSSGFGTKGGAIPLVAIYTGHRIEDTAKPNDYTQAQYIAYSLDKGRTWTKYSGNPVLDIHQKDFRDPKVFWYAPTKSWIMALVLPKEYKVQFYGSSNLKEWKHLSDFGPAGDTSFIWECPDLVQVSVQGQPSQKKWVLLNSVQFAMQYFVGEFDGVSFHNENPPSKIFRPDLGPDYYAAITYNNLPKQQQPVLLGWANSWRYANSIPTYPWKSAMATPRNLWLEKSGNEWLLVQKPLPALLALRSEHFQQQNIKLKESYPLEREGQSWELDLDFISPAGGKTIISFAKGKEHATEIIYDAKTTSLLFNRTNSGNTSFHPDFLPNSKFSYPLAASNGHIQLQIFFDHSIVEIFSDAGKKVFTAQLFPEAGDQKISIGSVGGETQIRQLDWWKLKSAW